MNTIKHFLLVLFLLLSFSAFSQAVRTNDNRPISLTNTSNLIGGTFNNPNFTGIPTNGWNSFGASEMFSWRAEGVTGIKEVRWEYTSTTSAVGANTNLTDFVYTNGVYWTNFPLFTGNGSTTTFAGTNTWNLILPSPYTNSITHWISNNQSSAIGNSWLHFVYHLTNSTVSSY